MMVSGQLHTTASLPSAKQPSASISGEAVVLGAWGKKDNLLLQPNIEPRTPRTQTESTHLMLSEKLRTKLQLEKCSDTSK
jgi:hypothetical protein